MMRIVIPLFFFAVLSCPSLLEAQEKLAPARVDPARLQTITLQLTPTDLQTMTSLDVEFSELEASHGRLVDAANRLAAIYRDLSAGIDRMALSDRRTRLQAQVSELQEINRNYNLQYLQLQQQMQDESRRFTLLSNIMKTKHDTVKNSIGNIR